MATETLSPSKQETTVTDFLPLQGTDYVEFYVGNANRQHIITRRLLAFNLLLMQVLKRE